VLTIPKSWANPADSNKFRTTFPPISAFEVLSIASVVAFKEEPVFWSSYFGMEAVRVFLGGISLP